MDKPRVAIVGVGAGGSMLAAAAIEQAALMAAKKGVDVIVVNKEEEERFFVEEAMKAKMLEEQTYLLQCPDPIDNYTYYPEDKSNRPFYHQIAVKSRKQKKKKR